MKCTLPEDEEYIFTPKHQLYIASEALLDKELNNEYQELLVKR